MESHTLYESHGRQHARIHTRLVSSIHVAGRVVLRRKPEFFLTNFLTLTPRGAGVYAIVLWIQERRTFEMQLTPGLLAAFSEGLTDPGALTDWDWNTVAIFTCSKVIPNRHARVGSPSLTRFMARFWKSLPSQVFMVLPGGLQTDRCVCILPSCLRNAVVLKSDIIGPLTRSFGLFCRHPSIA